jgi:hypothetical protein
MGTIQLVMGTIDTATGQKAFCPVALSVLECLLIMHCLSITQPYQESPTAGLTIACLRTVREHDGEL